MHFKQRDLGILGVTILCAAMATSARASIIDFSAFGWQAQTDPGVDLVALSTSNNGVTLALEKSADFVNPPNADGTIKPLSITFTQVSPSAVPNLAIEDETVLNDTGAAWDGFVFGLTGGLSNGGAIPHFDSVDTPNFTVNPFTSSLLTPDASELIAFNGSVPSGNFPANLFRPGQVSFGTSPLLIVAEPLASGSDLQTFTFTEQPFVGTDIPNLPSPSSTCAVVVFAGLGVFIRPRRRACVARG